MPSTITPLRKALETDSTAGSFTAKVPTATEPSGAGVFNLLDRGLGVGIDNYIPTRILLIPYGGNDNNDVFNLRLWGWSKDVGQGDYWVPVLLCDLVCTLGNIAATVIGASLFLADTIVVTYGDTGEKNLGVTVSSPANDVPANALVHLRGCQYIEFDFDLSTNCDKMNCLWRMVDDC